MGKVSGKLSYVITEDFSDNKYTYQDLGYFTTNNFFDHTLYIGYKWLKPHSFYNSMYFNWNLYYSQHNIPRDYQALTLNSNINGQLKSLGSYYFAIEIDGEQHDYYEPRTSGYIFKRPSSWLLGTYLNSNDAKKFSYSGGIFHRFFHTNGSTSDELDLGTQYRFNKKLSVNMSSTITWKNNSLGYTTNVGDSVIFALRKVRSLENILTAKYNFNNKMGISFRARHYWSKLQNGQLKNLSTDGTLTDITGISTEADYNVNYFNIDMVYTWQFNPGSFFTITWKNAIGTSDTNVYDDYSKNLSNTLHSNELNTVSFKLIYYLDYLDLKRRNKRM